MIIIGLVAALFTVGLAGSGLTTWIFARSGRMNLIECVCLGWLLGSGSVSLLLWIGGAFCSGLVLQAVVTLVCLVLAMMGWRSKRQANAKFYVPKPVTVTEWILASIVALQLATFIFVSFKHTLGWDGLLNWEIKARYAFFNAGTIPASYYSSPSRAFSHPEYPLAIPFTELWLYLWMGEPNQFWVKIIFPLFYAACAPLLALLVARLSGYRWIGLLTAAFLAFVPSVVGSPGGIVVGYVDIPLSVFYLAAVGYLLLWFNTNDSRFLIVFAGCSAFLPWTKSEGIILWVIVVLLGFAVALIKRRGPALFVSILPGCLLIVAWRAYLKLVHLWPHSDFYRPSLHVIREDVGRLPEIFGIMVVSLAERAHWSIFWVLAGAAVIYLFVSRKLDRIAVAGAIIAPILLYSLTYVFSSWPTYTAHMTSSFPRLLLHVMPVGWLAIGLALGQTQRETQTL